MRAAVFHPFIANAVMASGAEFILVAGAGVTEATLTSDLRGAEVEIMAGAGIAAKGLHQSFPLAPVGFYPDVSITAVDGEMRNFMGWCALAECLELSGCDCAVVTNAGGGVIAVLAGCTSFQVEADNQLR